MANVRCCECGCEVPEEEITNHCMYCGEPICDECDMFQEICEKCELMNDEDE